MYENIFNELQCYLIFYVHNFMRVKNIYTTLICY